MENNYKKEESFCYLYIFYVSLFLMEFKKFFTKESIKIYVYIYII